ncbi:MAG: CopG family antitoxin [Bacillota bacterium]
MKELPPFKDEDEEAEFWATHDTLDYIDETEPVQIKLDPRLLERRRSRSQSKRLGTAGRRPSYNRQKDF